MTAHGYDGGRLNLPFVGISTFAKSPYVENWDAIDADVAVLGARSILGRNGAPAPASGRAASVRPPPCFPSATRAPTITRTTSHIWKA